jgi:hypothetical protein
MSARSRIVFTPTLFMMATFSSERYTRFSTGSPITALGLTGTQYRCNMLKSLSGVT